MNGREGCILVNPSRSMVARICSEPGVTRNGTLTFIPLLAASLTMDATRVISSYELFVHEPIRAADNSGHLSFRTAEANSSNAVQRSGVNGPFKCGVRDDKSNSIIES